MEAEQYTLNADHWFGIDVYRRCYANPPGTPVNAIVGVCRSILKIQTLNSYARLIWVRHLHGISDNCQSP